jgi:NAD(P)-dependent dehydrogenase (short-subunit alcohol dehydrogenase family)
MAIPTRKTTKEGVEMLWGVNHLGHFLLTHLLWDKVKKAEKFRVVNVSSLAHKALFVATGNPGLDFPNINFDKDYNDAISYGRSKLYNVLFTHALAERIDPKQGTVVSLHPGVVRTELMREMKAGPKGTFIAIFMFILYPLYWLGTKNPWQGAQTNLHCTLSDEVENGAYYADCKKDKENELVKRENWEKLWEISEQTLGLKFNP